MDNKHDVIRNCVVENNTVKLPDVTLERDVYLSVAKEFKTFGGAWKGGKTNGFVFQSDPLVIITQILNSENGNVKKEYQFFETPSDIADYMVSLADIKNDDDVLEPSAGRGAIIDAVLRQNKKVLVLYCEKMEANRLFLDEKYENNPNVYPIIPYNIDFLDFNGYPYDKIIANPPFSKNQDIDHIYKMYGALKDGGRIVTVSSKHWETSTNKKETDFRLWLTNINAKIINLDGGSFKSSGTMISSNIIIINK